MSPLKSSPARAPCQWMYAIPTQPGVMGNAAVRAGRCCVTFMLDKECFQWMCGSNIIAVMTKLVSNIAHHTYITQHAIYKYSNHYLYINKRLKDHVATRSDERTQLCSSPQPRRLGFSAFQLTVLILLPMTLLSCVRFIVFINHIPSNSCLKSKKSSEETLYTICSPPHSRQTQLAVVKHLATQVPDMSLRSQWRPKNRAKRQLVSHISHNASTVIIQHTSVGFMACCTAPMWP